MGRGMRGIRNSRWCMNAVKVYIMLDGIRLRVCVC
jgi:hypothetical protein